MAVPTLLVCVNPRHGQNGLPHISHHIVPVRAPGGRQADLLHPHGARDDEVHRGAQEGHRVPSGAAGAWGREGEELVPKIVPHYFQVVCPPPKKGVDTVLNGLKNVKNVPTKVSSVFVCWVLSHFVFCLVYVFCRSFLFSWWRLTIFFSVSILFAAFFYHFFLFLFSW